MTEGRPPGQPGRSRLQRRDARPEAGRCTAVLQWQRFRDEGRPQDRRRERKAGCSREAARWSDIPARPGPRQDGRRARPRPAGRRKELSRTMSEAEALTEAKAWLRGLRRGAVLATTAELSGGS